MKEKVLLGQKTKTSERNVSVSREELERFFNVVFVGGEAEEE